MHREESRGAHQRSDHPEINKKELLNYKIKMNNNNLEILQDKEKKIDQDLLELIQGINKINSLEDRLLE